MLTAGSVTREFTSGPSGYTGGEYESGLVLIDDKVGDPS
jgi:hypothetical protein